MDTKALRQKILDLAIRGKLVPQDPNDEPASVLLERIRVEKQQMVKEGKLKPKDIKNDTIIFVGEDNLHYEKLQDGTVKCIEDEIPFEVPEGWAWCRLTEITFEIFAGGDKPENYSKTQTDEFSIPIFANGAENDGLYGFTNKARVNKSAITVSARGTIGFCCIRHMPFVPIVRLITIVPAEGINIEYLRIVFQALIETGEGSSIPQLTVPGIKPKLIPIPPYSEQTRISNKLIEIEKIVSAVELNQESVVNYIKLAKSKILDLAIRGQLVPQDPNDEPASVLLERIRAEKEKLIKAGKIKRDKKESVIFKGEDNSYYQQTGTLIENINDWNLDDIPINWELCCLGEICDYGNCVNVDTKDIDEEAWVLDLEDIEKDSGKVIHKIRKYERNSSSTKHLFKKGQVLYSKLRPYLNKVVLADEEGFCTSEILPLNFSNVVEPQYALYYLMSPTFLKYANRCSYGVKMPRLGTADGRKAVFPLPPFEEQRRISQHISKIFIEIDNISNMLL